MYAGKGDKILDWLRCFFDIFFLPNMKSTKCERKTENSKFSYIDPLWKVQKLLLK